MEEKGMIIDLLWILLIVVLASLFWQQRKQSEMAKRYIERRCEQLNLQLLSVARGHHHFTWLKAPFSIATHYYFEFSADGMNCYQGYLVMKGIFPKNIYMPPYRV